MNRFEKRRKADRSGFTLIELVMVVMILAIVAGLAVPAVGWLRRSANYGAQANIQAAALASNLEFYRSDLWQQRIPRITSIRCCSSNAGDDPTATIADATSFGN